MNASVSVAAAMLGSIGAVAAFSPENGADIDIDGLSYSVQNADRSWSLQNPEPGTLRFELRPGDVWPKDTPVKERTEIAGETVYAAGSDIAIRYVFRVEPGPENNSEWLLIGQLHATDEFTNPIFAVELDRRASRHPSAPQAVWKINTKTGSPSSMMSRSSEVSIIRWKQSYIPKTTIAAPSMFGLMASKSSTIRGPLDMVTVSTGNRAYTAPRLPKKSQSTTAGWKLMERLRATAWNDRITRSAVLRFEQYRPGPRGQVSDRASSLALRIGRSGPRHFRQ